ncbi:MAG: Alkyl hydroperoxide reductase, partial [Candidatus Nomurabacteria bacterium GW2011_GWA2_35_80]
LIIIGGGPAGVAAAVYASRKRLKTLFITKEWGGQSVVSEQIFNWIGTSSISGIELANNLKNHVLANVGESLEVKEGNTVDSVSKQDNLFKIKTNDAKEFLTKTILITTGSGRRKLEAKNADKLEHKGLVTLLHRSEKFKADEITVEKVLKNPKMKAVKNVDILEIKGDKFVEGIIYKDKVTSQETELKVSGIFVEIGQIPNTSFVKDIVPLDEIKRIKINPLNQKTEVPGIWAAGDCTDVLYHQNNIATGDAVRALEDIYLYLYAK